MHQRRHATRHESVIDEDVFFDWQRGVKPLEITGAIVRGAVTQRQVLGACRGADRIRLDESQRVERGSKRLRAELPRNRETSEIVESSQG
jgi:hypothetical protein